MNDFAKRLRIIRKKSSLLLKLEQAKEEYKAMKSARETQHLINSLPLLTTSTYPSTI